jgi:hypothetical protein
MIRKSNTFPLTLALFLAVLLGVLLLVSALVPEQAAADLPRRPTPVPSGTPPTPEPEDDDEDDAPVGAYILLSSPRGTWSVVQWQGNDDRWHDVEGWRGALEGGMVIWWVDQKDFGGGPFRWAVYDGPGGAQLGLSAPFSLPAEANQTVGISVP